MMPYSIAPATFAATCLISLFSFAAYAEVQDSDADGFVSVHELVLEAAPADAYAAFVDVAAWWDASHSFGGDAAALSLDDRAGGCFCERTSELSVEHLRVINVERGRSVVLSGGLGPLQALAVRGTMAFRFEPVPDRDDRSLLRYRYVVGGYAPDGLAAWAEPVDRVQLGQLRRLQSFIAEGVAPNR